MPQKWTRHKRIRSYSNAVSVDRRVERVLHRQERVMVPEEVEEVVVAMVAVPVEVPRQMALPEEVAEAEVHPQPIESHVCAA